MQREQHKLAAESDSSTQSTQSSAKYKWDTPFNRAMNIMMGHPPGQRPQYGRVHGTGDGATWKYYYSEDPEAKRQRKKFSQVTIDEKVARAMEKAKAETKAEIIAACRDDMVAAFTSLIPTVVTWVQQNPNAPPSDFPMPSFTGSNSMNTAPIPVPSMATAPAPPPAPAPAPSSHSSPSSVSGLNVGPSTLAELDALTVNTRRTFINSTN